jgi:cold shock CspA family protein
LTQVKRTQGGGPKLSQVKEQEVASALEKNKQPDVERAMQTPVEIDFQGMEARPDLRAAIDRQVAALEDRFGRITAGRVVLKAPGGHHRTGGLFEINIHLALPEGRVVNIGRTPQNDERHADINYALNDAFKRARRQLQDHVRKLQGQVKQHEGLPLGTVAELDPLGEFGFIETDDGREIYFHRNSVLNGGIADLALGARVSFAEEMGEKGPQASTVKLMGKHSLKI